MTAPQLVSIAIHDGPGVFRAAALDADNRPWRLFLQRWNGEGEAARAGQILAARLRSNAPDQGGRFVDFDTGEQGFLANKDDVSASDGSAVLVRVVSAARAGKLARVKIHSGQAEPFDAFKAWKASLPGRSVLASVEDEDLVDAAFAEAITNQVGLPGGGRLFIERTRALTAIDIDTGGRKAKGSVGAQALTFNREAVAEAARQLALRDIGGAVVIDCIAPLNKAAGEQVRQTLLDAFGAVSQRKVRALAPSPFGLMEVSLAWGDTPIADILLGETGEMTPETDLLDGLREADRALQADGAGLFTLVLSGTARNAYLDHKAACDSVLKNRYGGRLVIDPEPASGPTEVRRR